MKKSNPERKARQVPREACQVTTHKFLREDVAGSKEKCGMSRDGGVAGGKLGRGAKGRRGRFKGKCGRS
jgi:hypothetical protein